MKSKKQFIILLILAFTHLGCEPDAVCGNGAVESGEQCDDSNRLASDGCNASCRVESGYTCDTGTACDPVCGDSMLVDAEVCDPTVGPGFDQYCSNDCLTATGRCGDGIVQSVPETCDDGNLVSTDGCANTCRPSFGFTCAANVCDASIVDGATTLGALTSQQRTDLCTWFVATLGGAGTWQYCGVYNYQVNSVSGCASSITAAGANCTVSQMEQWVASKGSACGVFDSTDASVCP